MRFTEAYISFLLQGRHGVKVGPGPQDLGPRDPGHGTWDPPQSLKVGPRTPLKI